MSLFRPDTLLAQALGDGEPPPSADPVTGGLIPPIQPSTTFLRDPDNAYRRGFDYTRDRNPTPGHAEAVLAALEGGARPSSSPPAWPPPPPCSRPSALATTSSPRR